MEKYLIYAFKGTFICKEEIQGNGVTWLTGKFEGSNKRYQFIKHIRDTKL